MTTPVATLLTVAEALKALRISRSMLHQLVRAGELRAVKFGRRTLFRPAALAEFIASHETKGEKAGLLGPRGRAP